MLNIFVCLGALLVQAQPVINKPTLMGNKLINDLMSIDQYNPLATPVQSNTSDYFSVQMQIEIYGVIFVDLMDNNVMFKAALRLWWTDMRLTWDPAQYNGINKIWLPSDP